MDGQFGTDVYEQGARTVLNNLVRPQGSITSRPGSRFGFEITDSTATARFTSLKIGDKRYIIEIGVGKIYIWKEAAGVFSQITWGGWSFPDWAANAYGMTVTLYGATIRFNGSIDNLPFATGFGPVRLNTTGTLPTGLAVATEYYLRVTGRRGARGALYPNQPDHQQRQAHIGFATSQANAESGNIIAIGGAGSGVISMTLYTPGNRLEFTTDYTEADLANISVSRNGEEIKLTDGTNAPITINKLTDRVHVTSGADDEWRISKYDSQGGPFVATEATPTSGTPWTWTCPTGSLGIILSPVSIDRGTNWWGEYSEVELLGVGDTAFGIDDANSEVVMMEVTAVNRASATATNWTTGVITHPSDGSVAVTGTTSLTAMRNCWSSSLGFPTVSGAYQQRAMFAGGGAYPNRWYASSIVNPQLHLPTDLDGNVSATTAMDIDIEDDSDSTIVAMAGFGRKSGVTIITGTGCWVITAANPIEALAFDNILVDQVNSFGGARVDAENVDKSVVYASSNRRLLYGIQRVDNDSEKYETDDLTLTADHILGTGVKRLAYQHEPNSTLWALKDDGKIAGVTILEKYGVKGWGRHEIAGTDVEVEDIWEMQSSDNQARHLYMLVKRTINGGTKRYVEYIGDAPLQGFALEDSFYLDCGFTYDGASTTTITGLNHLDGETVDVLADGIYIGTKTVASNQITLDTAASVVHVGYKYNSDLEPMPPDYTTDVGTGEGSLKRIYRAVVRLFESNGGTVGSDASTLEAIEYDDSTVLFSGDVEIPIDGSSERAPTVLIRQSDPLPLTISSVVMRVEGGSRGGE